MRHRRGQRQALGPAPQHLGQQQAVRLAVAPPAVRQPLRPGQAVPLLPVPQPGHRNPGPLGHLADRKHGRVVAGRSRHQDSRLHQVDDSNLIDVDERISRQEEAVTITSHLEGRAYADSLRRAGHPAPREPPSAGLGRLSRADTGSGPVAGIGGVPLHRSRSSSSRSVRPAVAQPMPSGPRRSARCCPVRQALPGLRAGHRAGVRHLGRLRRGGTARPAPRAAARRAGRPYGPYAASVTSGPVRYGQYQLRGGGAAQATQPYRRFLATTCQPAGALAQLSWAASPDGQGTSTTCTPAGTGELSA